jgi:cation diffusion facilitator CzcD-associated flavoprotein CzcO
MSDIGIVGAGFSGLGVAIRLKHAGASEIHAYLQRLVTDHDLGPHLRCGCELTGGTLGRPPHVGSGDQ